MCTTNTPCLDFKRLKLDKYKDFQNQKKTIFEYLKRNSTTPSMIAGDTGIPQKSIYHYRRDFEKLRLLYEVEKELWKISVLLRGTLLLIPICSQSLTLKALENGSK
jgi:hypothetical protein